MEKDEIKSQEGELETKETEVEELEEVEAVDETDETENDSRDIDWKATAMRYKKALKSRKEDMKSSKASKPKDIDRLERIELKLDGYSDETIDELMELGGSKFLKTKIGQRFAKDLKEQDRVARAVDIESSPKSEISKRYTAEELKSMPLEQLEKVIKETK